MGTTWFLLLMSLWIFSIPVLVMPLIVGLVLILKRARLHQFTGWYTFKPVIATPVTAVILSAFVTDRFHQTVGLPLGYLLLLLPGAALTLWILWRFRDLYAAGSRRIFLMLLVFDILRMVSMLAGVILFLDERTTGMGASAPLFLLVLGIALLMPTLVAVAALVIYGRTREGSAGLQPPAPAA